MCNPDERYPELTILIRNAKTAAGETQVTYFFPRYKQRSQVLGFYLQEKFEMNTL
jgi:hypothetical protein